LALVKLLAGVMVPIVAPPFRTTVAGTGVLPPIVALTVKSPNTRLREVAGVTASMAFIIFYFILFFLEE
jgi:apolipoprotein N-acyltransferase